MAKDRNSEFINNSRYQYEFGSEGAVNRVEPKKNAKNDPLATGSNLSGAFTNPLPVDVDEEYATEFTHDLKNHDIKSKNQATKARFQEDLQQNYNVELSEELLINKNKMDK
jgi:hypothetical protein